MSRAILRIRGNAPVPLLGFAWDANPPAENVTIYKIYHGNAPGTYNGVGSPVYVLNATTYRISTVGFVGRNYFALTAVNESGESGYSNEISMAF